MVMLTTFDLELVIVFSQQIGEAAAAVVGFVESGVQPFDHRPDGGLENPFVTVSKGDLLDGLGDQFCGILDGRGLHFIIFTRIALRFESKGFVVLEIRTAVGPVAVGGVSAST